MGVRPVNRILGALGGTAAKTSLFLGSAARKVENLLGRLQRVVLPVKRDRSPDNPKPSGDYSSCVPSTKVCPGAAGLARLHYGGYSTVTVVSVKQ